MIWTTPSGLLMFHKKRPKMLVNSSFFSDYSGYDYLPQWIGDYYPSSFYSDDSRKQPVYYKDKTSFYYTSELIHIDKTFSAYSYISGMFVRGVLNGSKKGPLYMTITPDQYEKEIPIIAGGGTIWNNTDEEQALPSYKFSVRIFNKEFSFTVPTKSSTGEKICSCKIMRDGHVYVNGSSCGIWPMYRLSHLFTFEE